MVTMKLFKRSGKAKKKWQSKGLLVDPHKTRIILRACSGVKPKHVPSWMYKKLESLSKTFAN